MKKESLALMNELMLGDWYSNSDGDYCKVIKNFGSNVWGQGNDVSDDTDNPQPITITEEILKANGIKWVSDRYYFTDSHFLYFNRKIDFVRVVNMEGCNHHQVTMPIKYVHELQHALRLCALNGLADNFKIK